MFNAEDKVTKNEHLIIPHRKSPSSFSCLDSCGKVVAENLLRILILWKLNCMGPPGKIESSRR